MNQGDRGSVCLLAGRTANKVHAREIVWRNQGIKPGPVRATNLVATAAIDAFTGVSGAESGGAILVAQQAWCVTRAAQQEPMAGCWLDTSRG